MPSSLPITIGLLPPLLRAQETAGGFLAEPAPPRRFRDDGPGHRRRGRQHWALQASSRKSKAEREFLPGKPQGSIGCSKGVLQYGLALGLVRQVGLELLRGPLQVSATVIVRPSRVGARVGSWLWNTPVMNIEIASASSRAAR
jgi:hypothetical protein